MLWLCCISVLLYTYIIYVTGDCNDYNATQEFIDLEASLAGEIIYPSDPTHSDLNNVENAYYDSIVTDSIIYVESEQDVVDTVKFFKKNKECAGDDSIPFRIRSGGHSYGGYSICENCMIIDMSRLNQVTFNSDDNTYTFGAGVVMDDMVDAFRINQRVMPSGAAGTVSISGYTLGGGVSFYARPLGLAADYLKCIKFVRANGKLVKSCARPSGSDRSENRPIYAFRGAGQGNNFGVVTEFTFETVDVNTLAGAYRGGFSLAVTTENLPTLTSLLQKYREINFEQADTYLTDSVSPSFSVGYNFQTAQYELGITCNYVGPDYLTAGRDYIIDVYLAAFESIYPDLYDTVEFENGTYIDRIEEQMENTASVQQFVSFDQRVSRLIVDSEAFSDEFISAFLNFHIGVTNQAVFFSQGIQFITISQVWGGKIANFDDGKLTSFPNRKSVGNLETFIIKSASFDPTNPVIIEDWKPIVDGYANDLDINVLSLLSNQLYVNYMTLYQDSYLDYFSKNNGNDNDKVNKRIFRRLRVMKRKYDPDNLFTFPAAVPPRS